MKNLTTTFNLCLIPLLIHAVKSTNLRHVLVWHSFMWDIITNSYLSPAWTISVKEVLLTHWGRVTRICVSKLIIIGSDNGLSPDRRQAIIWTNAMILLIEPLGTNCSEILIEIHIYSFKKMHLKMSSGKWRPFCLGLNVLLALIWGPVCQKQVPRAGTNNYIPQILWAVTTCPCPWYLLVPRKFTNNLHLYHRHGVLQEPRRYSLNHEYLFS